MINLHNRSSKNIIEKLNYGILVMLDSYANRVRFVRTLTKLSREGFEEKYGVNRNTLKSWELGVNTLTEKSAKILSDALNEEGFSCSPQWLIFGHGTEPRPLSEADDALLLDSITQQSKVIYEADYFKKNNPNSIVCMITDKSMYPEFTPGDYVGGVNVDIVTNLHNLVGTTCIATLNDDITVVRRILCGKNATIVLCPLNPQHEADVLKKEDIISIASIIWHRKNFQKAPK